MADEEKTPDAVMIPETFKGKGRLWNKIDAVSTITDEILKVDKSKGEMSHVRKQAYGLCFVTKDPYDTINHPHDSDLRGQPRYHWVEREDGIKLGYLVEGASNDGPVVP
jgi:hypothetical protein